MVHLADKLDTSFSQYPYRWDALAFSLLTTAMLVQIEGGAPSIMVALVISKGRRSGHNQPHYESKTLVTAHILAVELPNKF